jgi:predicted nuclease with TOPRIM domain
MGASKALPVYSDFAHMPNNAGLGTIKFAVGLREENAEEMIRRVFPMSKIVPGVKKEQKKKEVKKKVEEKPCERPDCSSRKEKLVEMQSENKGLRQSFKVLEGKIETTKNKVTFTEKAFIMAEEKNDTLNGQIEEAFARIQAIEGDVQKGESFNITLRNQLARIQGYIATVDKLTEDQNQQLHDMLESKEDQKIVFAGKANSHKHRDSKLADEVSVLQFPTDGDDSD